METVTTPTAKLRRPNSRRSTTGWASVNSQTTNTTKPMAAVSPRPTIKGELNQSSSLPLSSISCSEPTHSTSRARPTWSIGSLRRGSSRFW